jgi:hypothetical protein
MKQPITVASAARLLGVCRHELQEQIRRGELETFEGRIDPEALKVLYPGLSLDQSRIEERVGLLKQGAFARRVRQEVMPDPDDLPLQLQKSNVELAVQRARAERYLRILEEVTDRLGELGACSDGTQPARLSELNRWLADRLQK